MLSSSLFILTDIGGITFVYQNQIYDQIIVITIKKSEIKQAALLGLDAQISFKPAGTS